MRTNKLLASVALVAAGAMAFAGCTPPANNDNNSGGNGSDAGNSDATISVLWNQAFYSRNNQTASGNNVTNTIVNYMLSDPLSYYDKDLKQQKNPQFGSYEKISDNPLKVKITLADSAQWSDGTPVTAADLILAYGAQSGLYNTMSDKDAKSLQDKATNSFGATPDGQVYFNASSAALSLIKDFPEISSDNKSITYTFSKPFADWEQNLIDAGLPAHIVAKRALGESDPTKAKQAVIDAFKNKDAAKLSKLANSWNRDWDFKDMPQDKDLLVSDGPMIITDMAKDQYLTVSRNPNYKGAHKTKAGKITIRYNEDPSASVQALQNREVQVISPQATADVLKQVQALQGVQVNTSDQASYEHIDLTMDNGGPFDPKTYGGDEAKARKVRQAFLSCVPRQQIVDKLIKPLNPNATVRNSFTTMPSDPSYKTITAASGMEQAHKFDISASKQLLQEAGASAPMVRFMHADGNQRRQQEYQLIKEQCSQAGFEFTEMSEGKWSSKLGDGTYDAVTYAWSSTSTAVTESDANYRTGGQNNFSGYSNKDVDALYDELQVETDKSKQATINGQIEKHLVDDAFGTTVFQFPSITAWDKNVSGVSDLSLSPNFFWNFWEWQAK